MKASAIEFRLRMVIQIVIVFIAMWAPWVRPWDMKLRISTLEWLASGDQQAWSCEFHGVDAHRDFFRHDPGRDWHGVARVGRGLPGI